MSLNVDLVKFVESLELSHKPLDHKEQADVVGGSVVVFTANVSGDVKEDITNITIFAQLGANHKFDREKQTSEWYKEYFHIMEILGFVVQEFDFQAYHTSAESFTMDKAVLDIFKAAISESETAVVKRAIDALGKLTKNARSLKFFKKQSSAMNAGNFQIALCDKAENGDIVLKLGAFYYTTKIIHEDNVLFWNCKANEISFYYTFQTMVFNVDVYKRVRQAVIDKLGDKTKALVAPVY